MSEQEFITAVKGLSIKMDSLNQNLGTNQITPFDGDPKLFKRWIKAIEKHAFLEGVPAENVKMIALKTSTGAVSDFIQMYFKAHQRVEWDTLKAELSMRFAEITDSQNAFMLLRQVKQEKFENVQIFAERLLSIAEEAYQGDRVRYVDLTGMSFSTRDKDNDKWIGDNCAGDYGKGGWWFYACHHAFLNGEWNSVAWDYPWYPAVRDGREIKETLMMIKTL